MASPPTAAPEQGKKSAGLGGQSGDGLLQLPWIWDFLHAVLEAWRT